MIDDVGDDKIKCFEKSLKEGKLTEASRGILSVLTAREAMVFRERFGIVFENDPCIKEIGKQFDDTRHRILEIEVKALKGRDPDDEGPDAA
jgi:DNA-directed RNA polymerase sigma subunit (sigma70/sigma32)